LQLEPLTAEEQPVFQAYPERGARILGVAPELRNAADIVRFHHENFDGSGYPRGLTGEQIPLGCRIIRVALAYDLLTRPKPPSLGLSHEQAVSCLRERSGQECDPRVLELVVQLNLPREDTAEAASVPSGLEAVLASASLPSRLESV
jgi:HD-GYP domain-containing protein (c-di-GMP phosphodiesterase class II)